MSQCVRLSVHSTTEFSEEIPLNLVTSAYHAKPRLDAVIAAAGLFQVLMSGDLGTPSDARSHDVKSPLN